jgi:hypothetical protein
MYSPSRVLCVRGHQQRQQFAQHAGGNVGGGALALVLVLSMRLDQSRARIRTRRRIRAKANGAHRTAQRAHVEIERATNLGAVCGSMLR